jgi:transposase
VSDKINPQWASQAVADKGYHSNDTMRDLGEMQLRSYISEPERGRRNWTNEPDGLESRDATYANRRRIKGERGKALMRKRGEFLERSFAHNYETGAMRRLHLRGRENIAKRVLIHTAGFNIGLMMRTIYGLIKPRRLSDGAGVLALWLVFALMCVPVRFLSVVRSVQLRLRAVWSNLNIVNESFVFQAA